MSAESKLAALEVADWIWGQAKAAGATAISSARWVGGALQGEFNAKPEVGQIVVDAVISMFPIAGEVTAARDVVAISLRMSDSEEESNSAWNWIALVLCLLAVVPVVGGIVKGVGRLLLPVAKKATKASDAVQGIIAFLRKMGVGNPHAWLQKLDFMSYAQPVRGAFDQAMERIKGAVAFLLGHASIVLPATVKEWLTALPPKLDHLKVLADTNVITSLKQLNKTLDEVRGHLIEGSFHKISVTPGKTKVMTQEARIAEHGAVFGESLGHKAAPLSHYHHKEGWPDLEALGEKDRKTGNRIYPEIASFSIKAPIEPVLLKPGQSQKLVRVIPSGDDDKKFGRFWTERLPINGRDWRRSEAVKHDWNSNGSYVILERMPTIADLRLEGIQVADDWGGVKVWKGQIAEQVDDVGELATNMLLPGGGTQLYLDLRFPENKPLADYIAAMVQVKPTDWKDAIFKVNDPVTAAVPLNAMEHSAKISSEGYLRRGAAIVGKQGNNEE